MILKNNSIETPKGLSPNFRTEPLPLQQKVVDITTKKYSSKIEPDEEYSGMSSLTVNFNPQPKLGSIHIEPGTNGDKTYNAKSYLGSDYDGFSKATINPSHIQYDLQDLEIDVEGDVVIYPDPEYDGLGVVSLIDTTPGATDIDGMKYANTTIEEFPDNWYFATRTGNNGNKMFFNCQALKEMPKIISFDKSATSAQQIFANCTNLTTFPEILNMPPDITRAFDHAGITHPNPDNVFKRVKVATDAFYGTSLQEPIKAPFLVTGTEMYESSKIRCIMPVLDLNKNPKKYTKDDLSMTLDGLEMANRMFNQTPMISFYGSVNGTLESDTENSTALRDHFVKIVESLPKDEQEWGLYFYSVTNAYQFINSGNFGGLIPYKPEDYNSIKDNLDYWDDFVELLNSTNYYWDFSAATNCTNLVLGMVINPPLLMPNIRLYKCTSLNNFCRGGALIMGGLEGLRSSVELTSPTKRSLQRVIQSLGDATELTTKPILTVKKSTWDTVEDTYKELLTTKGWDVKVK